MVVKNKQAVYHLMSGTALGGYPFGDTDKEAFVHNAVERFGLISSRA